MNRFFKLLVTIVVLIIGYSTYLYIKEETTDWGHKVIICIPVYGQSLALGEEAIRITDFDSLRINNDGRIVTENLDYSFGFLDDSVLKQQLKKLVNYNKRSFELSVYSMAEELVKQIGEDTIICIFPGGKGMSSIDIISKSTESYNKLLYEIKNAYSISSNRGWEFFVPAICWMQGESDIIDYPQHNYKRLLKQFSIDINKDIKKITNQREDIPLICYQSNVLTIAKHFDKSAFNCVEMQPAQAIIDLIREDTLFWASGPTYPYTFVNEKLHIDALGQQEIGKYDADAVIKILRHQQKTSGLIPQSLSKDDSDILVHFKVPYPPLVIDTIQVKPIDHYGFSVINKDNKDILSLVTIEDNIVRLKCSESPHHCKVRYAVNGEKEKSGFEHGPRGNLRDSHPLKHWCYQFDMLLE